MDAPRGLRLPSRAQLGRSLRAARAGDVVGIFASPGERETLDRVQAAMAVVEGHAEHVMDAVAPDLLPSLAKLRSAMDRRRRSRSGLAQVLGKLLGMEMKLRQYEQGKAFCDAIVDTPARPRCRTSSPLPRRCRRSRRSPIPHAGLHAAPSMHRFLERRRLNCPIS